MQEAMTAIAGLGMRLARGGRLRPADEDGRIPMGYRANWVAGERAATRAVRMLVGKLRGEATVTEVALPEPAEVVSPAPAVIRSPSPTRTRTRRSSSPAASPACCASPATAR
jgi:glycine reductase